MRGFAHVSRSMRIGMTRRSILKRWYALQETWGDSEGLAEDEAAAAIGIPLPVLRRWEYAWRDGGLDGLAGVGPPQVQNVESAG